MSPYEQGLHAAAVEARKIAHGIANEMQARLLQGAGGVRGLNGAMVALREFADAIDPQPPLEPALTPAPIIPQIHAEALVVMVVEGDLREEARVKGYEGDPCPECGNFTLLRNGICMKCATCGATTGCN